MKVPWASDPWFGEDKLTHAVYCYAGALTFALLMGWWRATLLVVLAAIAVEVTQWVRWDIWNNAAKRASFVSAPKPPQPAFSDQPSYRDLAWDGVGLVIGLAVAWWLMGLYVELLR